MRKSWPSQAKPGLLHVQQPPRGRTLFVQHPQEGLSYEDIADFVLESPLRKHPAAGQTAWMADQGHYVWPQPASASAPPIQRIPSPVPAGEVLVDLRASSGAPGQYMEFPPPVSRVDARIRSPHESLQKQFRPGQLHMALPPPTQGPAATAAAAAAAAAVAAFGSPTRRPPSNMIPKVCPPPAASGADVDHVAPGTPKIILSPSMPGTPTREDEAHSAAAQAAVALDRRRTTGSSNVGVSPAIAERAKMFGGVAKTAESWENS